MFQRPTGPLDHKRLANLALEHLARRSDSAAGLTRALARKVARARQSGALTIEDADAAIQRVVADLAERGLLSDAKFAAGRARYLSGRAKSSRAIAADLAARGVARDDVAATLAEFKENEPDAERRAAIAFARKRRLGPFRPDAQRRAKRMNDLASLQRAGFDGALARAVIDANPETLEDP